MLRPWPFQIIIDRTSAEPVYLQIARSVVDGIRTGRLPADSPMPGSARLAELIGVNRKTVQLAYEDLIAQGWLNAQPRRGTFVSPGRSDDDAPAPDGPAVARKGPPGPGAHAPRDRAPIPAPPDAGMFLFDDGVPDARLVPVTALAQAYGSALRTLSRTNRLCDEHPLGSPALRGAIATMLNYDRGIAVTPDGICLTRGSQMSIYAAASVLIAPGDVAAVEHPGYGQARNAFHNAGAEVVPLPVDGGGLDVDALERLCRKRPLRCLYTTPHHQYPTTVVMGRERRERLLALASRHRFVIVEDDYDHEFHFTRAPILPLASQPGDADVIYVGSFSKIVANSLRSGYIAGPAWFLPRLAAAVARIDRQGDPAKEMAVAELIESGEMRRHFNKAKRVYDERRLNFGAALTRLFGADAQFGVPEGGLAFWVTFARPFGTAAFAARARALGVRAMPGRLFTGARTALHATRIGYAHHTPAEMEVGLVRLRQALLDTRQPGDGPAPQP